MKVWKKWELMSMRYEGNCWVLRVSIGLLPHILIVLWKETLLWKDWKEIRVDVDEIWRKMLVLGASIGLLPLILIVLWNETLLWKVWKEIRVDVNEIWRKMLAFRVSIGLLPLFIFIMQNKTLLWKFERNWELMLMRYEGKCKILEKV